MCKAVKDMRKKWLKEGKVLGIEEGRVLGIEEGKVLGIEEGKASAMREIVTRLLRKSKSILEICDITGASRETIECISLALQSES